MEGATVLTTVMKGVADALKLDSDGSHPKEAYFKYLECMLRITTKLCQDIRKEGVITIDRDVQRFVRLGQQCMDRIVALIGQLGTKSQTTSDGRMVSGPLKGSVSAPTTPSGNKTLMDMGTERTQTLHSDSEIVRTTSKGLSPMEAAYIKNEQLRAAYKSRLESLHNRKTSVTFNFSLTIQRKIMENLAIAKAQEEAKLERKMQERQLRLREEAERKFNGSTDLTQEEEDKKEFYRQVLEYEHDNVWLTEYRRQLEEVEIDNSQMLCLITRILSCTDHPLTIKLKKFQYKLYEKLYPIVSDKLDHIHQIKVPLPKYLHPPGMTAEQLCTATTEHEDIADSNTDDSQDDSDIETGNVFTDDGTKCTSSAGDLDTKCTSSTGDLDTKCMSATEEHDIENSNTCSQHSENSQDSNKKESQDQQHSMEDVCDNIRTDLQISISRGEKVKDTLEQENKQAKTILQQVSKDYDSYNIDDMDDLFDEDEDDEGDKWSPPLVCPVKGVNLPTNCQVKGGNSNSINGNNKNELISEQLQDSNNDNVTSEQESKSSLPREDNTRQLIQPELKGDNTTQSSEDNTPKTENSLRMSSSSMRAMKPIAEEIHAMDDRITCLRNEAFNRHLKGVTEDVHTYLENIQSLFFLMYDQLNTPQGQDMCYSSVEKVFFNAVWKYIVALYRLANEPKEIAVAFVMTCRQNCSPLDFHVTRKLRLDMEENTDKYPYMEAVDELKSITAKLTLLDKLECLVKSSKLVCKCVEEFYSRGENSVDKAKPSVGADDLLPLLCYIITKTQQPEIVSECQIMQDFIHEGYIMGEEGYCLTSFQTAIAYLTSLGMED